MSQAGPTICGTGADGGGATPWVNPGNITANDGSFAAATLTALNVVSNELLATNFGFTIPSGATILGIQVDFKRQKV